MKTLFLAVTLVFALTSCMAEILSDEFIKSINEKQSTWIAARNFPEDTPIEHLKRLTGTFPPNTTNVPMKFHEVNVAAIPEYFDSRDNWPQCESIREIRSQGQCGACWAFSSSEVITDRICIASNGNQKFKFSSEHLLSCCGECGSCAGGYMDRALNYYVSSGVVSGGDFNSYEGCQPYEGAAYNNGQTPGCSSSCTNPNYGVPYEQDKHYGSTSYWVGNTVEQIQTEIMKNGPVATYMDVYGDFYSYSSGVYMHTSGGEGGGHGVKIIGWGTENGTPYWLVANSWGSGWAGLGGFFKIVRGQNNCRIEEWVYGSIARL